MRGLGVAAVILSSIIAAVSGQTGGLRIVVVAGEDAVNIIQQKTAVAPVVEVRDRNDLPVAGVPVTFTVAGAKSASFAGGVQTITVITNAAGRAAVSGLTPLSNGVVRINVQAAFQAQTATATITQTNFATAAQAAQAGTPAAGTSQATTGGGGSGSGGGISKVAIAAIGGAAAAGGLFALQREGTAPNYAPVINGMTPSPPAGLVNSTTITFSDQAHDPDGDALTREWDFGDGATSSLERPTHIYTGEGAFTVRLTIRDATHATTSQVVVTIKSMTGRWRLGTTSNFYDLTQTGTTIAGVFSAGPGVRRVLGAVRTTSPHVTFSETEILTTIPPVTTVATFTGDPGFDANVISGVFNGGGFPANTLAGISRQ
jgi:hypothetical protein